MIYARQGVTVATLAPSNWGDTFFYSLMRERRARLADIRGLSLARDASDIAEARRSPFELDITDLERGLRALGLSVEPVPRDFAATTAVASNWPPKSLYQMIQTALKLRAAGKLAEAEIQLRQAIERAPDELPARVDLVDVLMRQGRLPDALTAAEKGLALCRSAEMLRMVGDHLNRLGRYAEAVEFARRAVALDDDDAEAKVRLGHLLCSIGQFAEAATYFEQALHSRGEDDGLRLALGRALAAAGRSHQVVSAGKGVQIAEKTLASQLQARSIGAAGGGVPTGYTRRPSMQMGYVDIAQRDKITGWAADSNAPDEVLELAIVVNGREAGRVKADRLRIDLQRLGKYGDGKHGFEFKFEPPLDPTAEYEVVVRFTASEAALTRGAFKIGREREAAANGAVPAVYLYDRAPQPKHAAAGLPRYILHVGLPKTGTKYLQHNFWQLRQQLRAAGVYYPSEWWRERPLFAHHQLAEDLKNGPDAQIAEIFSRLNVCDSETVLLSSEGFNPVPDRGLEYLRDLTDGAKVEIVFYARRWSDWIPSQWQQAVKQGSLQTFPEWYAAVLCNANRHPGINQAIFLDKFSRIFGRQNIRLISYSNLVDCKVDLFEHFCSKVLGLTGFPAMNGGGQTVHESMGILLTELMRCLNAREVMRSGVSGYHVFEAYRHISSDRAFAEDIKSLHTAMEKHVAEVALDDSAYFLDPIYARLNEYRDLLVSPECGRDIFERRSSMCRYVQSDYLMEYGALAALERISEGLRRHLGAVKATPPAA